jgi:hypothetical protein
MSMDREAIEALRIMLTAHPVGHTLTEEDESMDGLYNELCDLALEGLAQPEGGEILIGGLPVLRECPHCGGAIRLPTPQNGEGSK